MRLAMITLLLAAQAGSATQALEARDRQIREVVPRTGAELTPAERAQVEETVTDLVDLDGIARAALGKAWGEASPAQRRRFMKAFTQRFRRAATEQLDFYRTTHTKFGAERQDGEDVIVPSTLTVKGEPTQVDYRMRRIGGRWRIEDIVVDDVSTVEDYKSAFAKIIRDSGFDGLITRLEKRNEPSGR